MKKLNNKGFTLVEIVIVIVIIAILAAMLVPSLTQWIDKSKTKTFTSACGTIKTAVWAEEAEAYATGGTEGAAGLFGADGTVSKAVGQTVTKVDSATHPNSGYAVMYTYSTDSITVLDKNFKGVWDHANNTWKVSKAS
ncbi:MAG: prepilin-type N-terminal cleavage/methylation domain-containing protein [Oscillospiraceae bacterium]|nr:prepilin-type N-terminal cleavage/methylation domain-containing protein [Candidatus Limimonas egerieequi]